MSICAARTHTTPSTVCNAPLPTGKTGCLCRLAVEEDIARTETRVARVPDSATTETEGAA